VGRGCSVMGRASWAQGGVARGRPGMMARMLLSHVCIELFSEEQSWSVVICDSLASTVTVLFSEGTCGLCEAIVKIIGFKANN